MYLNCKVEPKVDVIIAVNSATYAEVWVQILLY